MNAPAGISSAPKAARCPALDTNVLVSTNRYDDPGDWYIAKTLWSDPRHTLIECEARASGRTRISAPSAKPPRPRSTPFVARWCGLTPPRPKRERVSGRSSTAAMPPSFRREMSDECCRVEPPGPPCRAAPGGDRVDRELWAMVVTELRADVGAAVFDNWLASMGFERLEARQLFLSVPTAFLRSWNRTHYYDAILSAARTVWPDLDGVTIELRGTAWTPLPSKRPVIKRLMPALPRPSPPLAPEVGSPLDRRFTFETFVVGASNRQAHATAEMIIQGGWPVTPLVIHGRSGIGKTHLLQALAAAARKAGRTAIYLTAERFMYGIVVGLRGNTVAASLALLDADVIIIDDLQFLCGQSIGEAVCRLIDEAPLNGRNIVFGSDAPVLDLELKDERLRSRLSGGLSIAIDPLDMTTRTEILRMHIAAAREYTSAFALPDDVIVHVASLVQGQGRELIGAVNRLQAHASMFDFGLVTRELAAAAMADLVRQPNPKRVKIETIQAVVAEHFNVSRGDIMSARRTMNVVRPRQVAMHLSKTMTLRSLPEIGRRFGGRDHTTVLHAVRKIEHLKSVDVSIAADLEFLRSLIEAKS